MGQALVEAVLRGGYPEAVARTTARRRNAWACQYVDAIKSPKLQFMDSGLLAYILNLNADAVQRNRSRFGHVLETFVSSEQFKMGVVLYDGTKTMPMGKGLWAAPLSSLWGT